MSESEPRKPTVEEVNKMLAEVLAEKGYIVIGTKPGRLPYLRGQPVYEFLGIPQEGDYIVDCFTDFAEYLEQMKHFAEIRPAFPLKVEKCVEEEGQHFYRVVEAPLAACTANAGGQTSEDKSES